MELVLDFESIRNPFQEAIANTEIEPDGEIDEEALMKGQIKRNQNKHAIKLDDAMGRKAFERKLE